jgi:hypothetical protein
MKPDNKSDWIQLTVSILGLVTAVLTLLAAVGGR